MHFKAKDHYATLPTVIDNSKQKRRTHRKIQNCHLCCLSIVAVLILSLSHANLMHYGVIIFQKNAPHDDKAFKSFLKTCAYNL